ncbi:MAG: hypothetical protein JJE22_14760 [Bacteroidia bacterium]|nr:hypothetical protein [Bacteroidia bacterium]
MLYSALLRFIEPYGSNFPSVFPLIAFTLLFLQAIIVTRFINNNRMISLPGYLPGMAYMLITSLFPEWNYLSAPLIVNTIFLFTLSGLLKIYNQQNAKGTIFNIGLGLGIALFLFFPSLAFIIWVLLGMLFIRPFRLNEWVLCIVGIATPLYFYAIYLFISSQGGWQNLLPHFSFSLLIVKQSAWLAGSAFLLALPFLAGGYYVQGKLRRMLIQVRLGWSLLLLYLLAAVLVPFVNGSYTFENWIMCTVPFAAFHACTYLYSNLRIFPLLLFWLTVSFVLGYQYYGPGW